MGSLKPGATYVYESPDGGESIYAREQGSNERILVGVSYKKQTKDEELRQAQLWFDMRKVAHTNPTLQAAIDRAILIYQLSKEDGQ
jgi:hypothetical protein